MERGLCFGRRSWAKPGIARAPKPNNAGGAPRPPRGLSLSAGFSHSFSKPSSVEEALGAPRRRRATQILGQPNERPRPTVPIAVRGSDLQLGCRVLLATGASQDGPGSSAGWRGTHQQPSAPWLQMAFLFPVRLWCCVIAAHLSAHNKQKAHCYCCRCCTPSVAGCLGGNLPACSNARWKKLGISAVYARVTCATHNYAGVNCVIGNASSFKLSLEYRGLILTIQQRF